MTTEDVLEIKEYLRESLTLERRSDLKGNKYIALILDDDILGLISEDEDLSL